MPAWVSRGAVVGMLCKKQNAVGMLLTKISGVNALTGDTSEIHFAEAIWQVLPSTDSTSTFVAPGFVDLQVNGFTGIDFNSPAVTIDDIDHALAAMFSTGVTRCFPTLITNGEEQILQQLRTLVRAKKELPNGLAIQGIHVEGPHISPEDGPRGAHPREWVRPPDTGEYQRWQDAAEGCVRLITVAPEWPGAIPYIENLVRDGVVVSLGHTRASAAQIHEAVLAGATMSTHLGNGAGSKDRRDRFIEQQLNEDRLTASFIIDGHHLPSEFLRRALAAKGYERSVLVTDAAAPAMCAPGPYTLGGVNVELRIDGRVTLRGQDRLAGSSLRMDRAIGNAVRDGGVSWPQAIAMATLNPARVLKIAGVGLKPKERADVVVFQTIKGQIVVEETYLAGRRVFTKTA